MTPLYHAESNVKKYGGVVEDYMKIHNFFDQTKAYMSDLRHRAILHNSFGIALCLQMFGDYIVNADGKRVPVKMLAEEHVLSDLKFLPSFNDCFGDMPLKDWMLGKHPRIRELVMTTLDEDSK